jgi:nucleoside-diphosphate-sugar epimerase
MSRVVVIGATGHIGTYLVPRLVRAGHDVTAMSRGLRGPYHDSPEWKAVTSVTVDRDAGDAAGTFGAQVAALRPDVVIDLVCFTAASARQLVDALRPAAPLLVHCGTIWVHGPALRVPVTEAEPRTAYGAYGTGKAEIEALLHAETAAGGVPAVILHPGHISGPGWPVITPAGNLDPAVWTSLATGRPLALPDHGLGVLNHVHADDVAQAFELALSAPAAVGASFHVVAEQAMTLPGTPWRPASTPSAASPRASPAPGRSSATRRSTAPWTPCARRWPGWPPTARPTSAARHWPSRTRKWPAHGRSASAWR